MIPRTLEKVLLLMLLAPAGCAPRSTPIEGSIARWLQEGIARGKETFDHSKFDAILQQHVKSAGHRFDYAALKTRQGDLEAYLQQLEQAEISRLSRPELLAFFINAYNACTIHSILESMTPDRPRGVAGIRDIPNVFGAVKHRVGGATLSLDNMEHNILRPFFKDPRIHFAVNCASVSCPPLWSRAYRGDKIDEQLDETARRALQSPDYVRIENGRLFVTKILDWYGSDFVTPGFRGAAGSLAEFIARYATEEVRQFIRGGGGNTPLSFMSYDWSLNSVG